MEPSQVRRTRYLPSLDALRGLAALAVVLGHARELMAPTSDQAYAMMSGAFGSHADLAREIAFILLMPATFAREAVAIFFALSGFWVGGSVIRATREGRFSWRSYLIARLTRLWIVLGPALLLTAILDIIAMRLHGNHSGNLSTHSFGAAVGNLFFLQPLWVPSYGSNVSLWSLSYEFWFYIAFPGLAVIGLSALRLARARFSVLLYAILIFGILAITPIDWGVTFIPWVAGALVSWGSRRVRSDSAYCAWTFGGLAFLLVALVVSNVSHLDGSVQLAVVGCSACPLIYGLSGLEVTGWSGIAVGKIARLGPWSYSLYAFHAPVIVLGYSIFRPTATLSLLAVVLVYSVSLVAVWVSFALSRVTEIHTDWLRRVATRAVETVISFRAPVVASD